MSLSFPLMEATPSPSTQTRGRLLIMALTIPTQIQQSCCSILPLQAAGRGALAVMRVVGVLECEPTRIVAP